MKRLRRTLLKTRLKAEIRSLLQLEVEVRMTSAELRIVNHPSL